MVKARLVKKSEIQPTWEHLMDGNEWLMTDSIVADADSFLDKVEQSDRIENEFQANREACDRSRQKSRAKRAKHIISERTARAAGIAMTAFYMLGGVLA